MIAAITDLLSLDDKDISQLKDAGIDVTFYQDSDKDVTMPADIWVGRPPRVLPDDLKFMQLLSAGFDHVDMDALKQHNVTLANGRGIYSVPIAEYCVGYVLSIYKEMPQYQVHQEAQYWKRTPNMRTLEGSRVLLLGTGSIASETAIRFKAFSCHVDGMNSNGRHIEHFDACYPLADLEKHINNYDVVIVTLPANDATYHIMNEKTFGLMKEDAVFINIGRGSCVDLDGLMRVLDTHLAAAVLDVFETEPLPQDHPFWTHPKAILTPHSSNGSDKMNQSRKNVVMRNLLRFVKNEALENVILG